MTIIHRNLHNLGRSVEELELSVRSYRCLEKARLHNSAISDLVRKSESDLLQTGKFTRKALKEINKALVDMGLSLGMTFDSQDLQLISSGIINREHEDSGTCWCRPVIATWEGSSAAMWQFSREVLISEQ